MEWIKCSEALPKEEGVLAVLIGDKVFFGEAYISAPYTVRMINSDSIEFEIPSIEFIGQELSVSKGLNDWILPSHFKKPSHWMYLPDLPRKES